MKLETILDFCVRDLSTLVLPCRRIRKPEFRWYTSGVSLSKRQDMTMTTTLNMSVIMTDGATYMRNKRPGSLDREKNRYPPPPRQRKEEAPDGIDRYVPGGSVSRQDKGCRELKDG